MKKKKRNDQKLFCRLKKRFDKVRCALLDNLDDDNNSNNFTIFEVIVIIIISMLFGGVLSYVIFYSNLPSNKGNSNVKEIINTYNVILDNYYGEIDEDKLLDAAVKGMIESLDDPYSNYMDKDVTQDFNQSVDGSFVGIGVTVLNKKIISINKGGPAEKSGLMIDDLIIKVDGIDVTEMTSQDFINLVRGKKGTKVKITVLRNDTEKEFTVTRGIIEIDNVTSKIIKDEDKDIGYIKISSFASNSYKQLKEHLEKLEKSGINSLVIDLRDNHGGHLLQTRQMLSLFFNKKTVLYQLESKKSARKKIYSKTNEVRKYPIAILINGGSASASEIFASCFKENYKNGVVVGTTSYGKGTVQKSQSLSDGTSIKYTTDKWLTSKGKWLNDKGLEPDIIVEQSDEYYESPIDDNDLILNEAIKQLKESK